MHLNNKLQLITFILFVFLYSCKPVSENNSASDKNVSLRIFKIDSTNNSLGFGYDILMNGERYIHQSTIPAVSGNQYFKTEDEAKTVASFVCNKIQNNILPPTISLHELDSLGITIK